jgi:hypothetical protein
MDQDYSKADTYAKVTDARSDYLLTAFNAKKFDVKTNLKVTGRGRERPFGRPPPAQIPAGTL